MIKAKDYLLQVQKLNRMIENKNFERLQWKAIASGTTGQNFGERVQTTPNPHKMADAITNAISMESEIEACIVEMVKQKKAIIATIERLKPTEYDMLHLIYIQGKSLQDVADRYSKTYSWATTVHGRALKNVQNILDEAEKGVI